MRIEILSKSVLRHTVATTALLLLSLTYARALCVETYSGKCTGMWKENTWIVVVTYDDNGRITHMCGTNCLGMFWENRCLFGVVAGNPNMTGNFGTVWSDGAWVQLAIAENGVPTKAWGLDREGVSWMTDDITLN